MKDGQGQRDKGFHPKLSLKIKIFIMTFSLVLISVLAFASLSYFNFSRFMNVLETSGHWQNETIDSYTTGTMQSVAEHDLTKYTEAAAELIDGEFWVMIHDMELLAASVGDILDHPDRYAEAETDTPDKGEEGKISTYILYSDSADRTDKAMAAEVGKLANLTPLMESLVSEKNDLKEVMISLPSGATLFTDRHPEEKLDAKGAVLPFNGTERPYYVGAANKHDVYFASTNYDYFTKELEVVVGMPVYLDTGLAAVCGGSRHLSDMEDIVESLDYSAESDFCLIDEAGYIVYSQWGEGELSLDIENRKTLIDSSDKALAGLAGRAVSGESGYERLEIDGEPVFIAYAPLENVGWSLLLSISQESLEKPTRDLLQQIDVIEGAAVGRIRNMSKQTRYIMLTTAGVLIIIAFLLSVRHSRKIVKPLIELKKAGIEFIEKGRAGLTENTDYFARLNLNTGDETEELWETMKELEASIERSARSLERVTAEKERIDTELSVATRIQSDLLPGVFPAFPDRSEFDLYSMMNPAKEVGGDFYDFFLIDDDHLALVMADVSGKGVPAALFMVVTKTLIKNVALSGGHEGPGDILYKVNNELYANNKEEMFVTVWLGILTLSTGHLVSASGGHEYPALCRKGGSFELIMDAHGPGLATFEDVDFDEWNGELGAGDLLFLYTDGVPEATDENDELFGNDRMIAALNDARMQPDLKGMLLEVRQRVNEFVGEADQFDDLTMTILEYKGDTG